MNNRFYVSPGLFLLLAGMVLFLPMKWMLAILLCVSFHELCHYAAIRLCGGRKCFLRFQVNGARMLLPDMSRGMELICALAGPVGSFLLIPFAPWMPRVAICGFAHGIYNLLPIYPLDGGRVLLCFLSLCFSPPVAFRIMGIIEKVTYLLLFLLSVLGFLYFDSELCRLCFVYLLCCVVFQKNSLQKEAFGGTIEAVYR